MQVRINASNDLIIKVQKILSNINIDTKIYNNRGSDTKRIYINLDDRKAEDIINKILLSNNSNLLDNK